MVDIEFEVAKRRHEPITFTLGDPHEYVFDPPKNAVMLMPILERDNHATGGERNMDLTKATFDWLGEGLSEEDNDLIKKRLRDKEDDLDVDTLSDVVQKLSEKVAGRPTT